MTVPSFEELDSLKYSDLQNLAKSLGLRANLRAAKLLKALKAHLKQEARKENENQDENQTSASSCDEIEIQIGSQQQAENEPAGHVTKTRRRRKELCGDSHPQDHLEIKISDPTEFQNQRKENQDLRTTTEVASLSDESQAQENTESSGKSGIHGEKDSKVPSGKKKSVYPDGLSKPGKNKRTANTTPNFKKLHEARFKEMESIDQYIERKKKHFEEHNSFNELKKQPMSKGGVVTPVHPRRPSVACTPVSQRRSQGRSQGLTSQSTLCLKGSIRRSALSTTKMNVRFSAATKDNEHKRSLTKTPARKSPHVIVSGSTPKGQAVLESHKFKATGRNSAAALTPFKLTAEALQTPVSNKKPVFDLKASLSRPLNYEPHKGKLKPWGQSKENSLSEHGNRVTFHKKTYKQPHLQTREEQRKKHEQERKEKKAKILGARRGLIMAKN
ncbi:nucleolar and spindle-associated protein 1 isoform X2 [Tupaia chinensis]|uniref:nucleolar and spindle-associated protein 1 isoform X2 n=1 Tax=Tupaia chinensis TaxID=246437 RepID=UPI0003C9232D|nr:nucleolar and spindle-associated protein 1 isoform X2 [Tupaia chinensis]